MSSNNKVSKSRIIILICSLIAFVALFYFMPNLETNNWLLKGLVGVLWCIGFLFLAIFTLFSLNVTDTPDEQGLQKPSLVWHTIPSIIWLLVNTVISSFLFCLVIYNFKSIPSKSFGSLLIVFSPLALVYICYLGIKKQYVYIKNKTVFTTMLLFGMIAGIVLFFKYIHL